MEKNHNIPAEFASTNLKRKNPTFSSLDNSYNVENNNDLKILKIDMGCYSNDYHGDDQLDVVLPVGFLDPLPPLERELVNAHRSTPINIETTTSNSSTRKQFWKAGDYEPSQALVPHGLSSSNFAGMDHVRVHPRFLHSNATSHKWVLGALAELLDNALDEVSNGATYVSIDMVINEKDRDKMSIVDKDRNRMLVVQDDGGGMNPSELRSCMSLGYSAKSKMANTIGQYGNGFKTSTMRLGSDVIVFSLCQGKNGSCATRSIGMLSYTFLTSTGKEDIVVPMIDYEKNGEVWIKKLSRTLDDWHVNLESIIDWSPFSSEQDLLQEFNSLGDQGTKIVIYNLWEDDKQQLELDFDTDLEDIQIRGVNRDEKKIAMARKYPNSKHYLTYQHSLRSYASILYLRLPPGFRIILRGKDVLHHNLKDDMIHRKELTYRPVLLTTEGTEKDLNPSTDMQAFVTMGFVKDAQDHMDIQGFNVYHKNRLIKPFWRVWNAAGSDGRGVIGVLEANFVSPAHDKQGFERTTTLQRLEARLIHMQKSYWRDNCHEIGYAPRRSVNKASSTAASPQPIKGSTTKGTSANKTDDNSRRNCVKKFDQVSPFVESSSEEEMTSNGFESPPPINKSRPSHSNIKVDSYSTYVMKLRKENFMLKERLEDAGKSRNNLMQELQLERDKCKSLEAQLDKANNKAAETDKEQEALIQIFAEERERRNNEEDYLRQRLQEASTTIEQLVDKVKTLEKMNIRGCKPEIY
ncbi:protein MICRORCHIDIA 7 [Beta vulgaris subsp. vulgaris]|uniref:protein MICRORCHIDIA 7 n=1 Tax=Beta vulgaris subsp. vulgaris TaxID=3555 RepID=UPI0025499150|nr:protein MICRORCHIDIA 7 [Beta vulgaris subsp. vulgaris]